MPTKTVLVQVRLFWTVLNAPRRLQDRQCLHHVHAVHGSARPRSVSTTRYRHLAFVKSALVILHSSADWWEVHSRGLHCLLPWLVSSVVVALVAAVVRAFDDLEAG